jgi:signal transduction histidine kinase
MSLRALLVGFILLLLAQAIGLAIFAGVVGGPFELAADGEAALRAALWLAISNIAFLLLLLAILSLRLGPLRRLEEALRSVGEGDLDVELPIRRQDEIGRLAAYFNLMTGVLRKRARQQGRFVAAGELLLGVAHEVNNPLMAISALAENRLARDNLDAEERADLQQMLRQSERAARLLAGLLRFLRTAEEEEGVADTASTIASALELVSHRLPLVDAAVETELPADLPLAAIEPNRLEQIIVNLLGNALDALTDGAPPRRMKISAALDHRRIVISVIDNGPGVAPEIAPRLFHPFVTSKGDRGTGMGLYFSRQIAREAGGELRYAPSTPRGSLFVLEVSAFRAETPAAGMTMGASPEPQAPTPGGTTTLAAQRILLVDDEVSLRRPIARFLTLRGARVLEAEEGLEALTLLESHAVDAVITDLRMPGMDGLELYSELERSSPELAGRTLFLSGDLAQLEEAAVVVPRDQVLAKPVPLGELEARLVELIRSRT